MSLIIHKCFDEGLLSINQDYKIVLYNDKRQRVVELPLKYKDLKINLPIKEHYPDKELLMKHMNEVFKVRCVF